MDGCGDKVMISADHFYSLLQAIQSRLKYDLIPAWGVISAARVLLIRKKKKKKKKKNPSADDFTCLPCQGFQSRLRTIHLLRLHIKFFASPYC